MDNRAEFDKRFSQSLNSTMDNQTGRVITIGISGPSASGKTTLVKAIEGCEAFSPLAVIHGDDFFKGLGGESPDRIDFAAFIDRIKQKQNNVAKQAADNGNATAYVVVEGFLLFCNRELADLMTLQVFLDDIHDASGNRLCDVLAERRAQRKKGWCDAEFYKETIWPSYLKFKPMQLENMHASAAHSISLDALQTKEELQAQFLSHVMKCVTAAAGDEVKGLTKATSDYKTDVAASQVLSLPDTASSAIPAESRASVVTSSGIENEEAAVFAEVTSAAPAASPPSAGGNLSLEHAKDKEWCRSNNVDMCRREELLSDHEFASVFGMNKAEFGALKRWKQDQLKKSVGLW